MNEHASEQGDFKQPEDSVADEPVTDSEAIGNEPDESGASGSTGTEASEPEANEPVSSEGEAGHDQQAEQPEPSELADDSTPHAETPPMDWYILKVQVNREDGIKDALARRVKIAGLDEYFGEIVVPTEDVAEFSKSGKRRIVKRKLYPGYIMVHMSLNDDTWFLVRETSGIGDFTGSAGKPTPMEPAEVERIIKPTIAPEEGEPQIRTAIPYKVGDRVRVKEGHFENFEGEVEGVDEANGHVTVLISIFGRQTPVELKHWHIESI